MYYGVCIEYTAQMDRDGNILSFIGTHLSPYTYINVKDLLLRYNVSLFFFCKQSLNVDCYFVYEFDTHHFHRADYSTR